MPFCTNCGNQVQNSDLFCKSCGSRQAVSSSNSDPLKGISSRTASMLCYIPLIGWLAGIVVLASPRFRDDRIVRFHAFQGLYIFVVWLMVSMVIEPTFRWIPGHSPARAVVGIMHLVIHAAWIWMIIKTAQEQMYHLPLVGELAERSVAEQR